MTAPRLNADDVRHVAKLARLRLTDDQIDAQTDKLATILQYIDKLNAVDITGVTPMAHAQDLTNVLRDDAEASQFSADDVLANAPERDGDFFKVPKVLGEGSS